jgi:hypothetical protein
MDTVLLNPSLTWFELKGKGSLTRMKKVKSGSVYSTVTPGTICAGELIGILPVIVETIQSPS